MAAAAATAGALAAGADVEKSPFERGVGAALAILKQKGLRRGKGKPQAQSGNEQIRVSRHNKREQREQMAQIGEDEAASEELCGKAAKRARKGA